MNHSWKGRGQGHVTRFKLKEAQSYLWNCWSQSHQILYVGGLQQVLALDDKLLPKGAWSEPCDYFFNFWALIINWEWVKQGTSNFGMHNEHASANAW